MPKLATPDSMWCCPHIHLKRATDQGIPLKTIAAEWLVDARHALTLLKNKLTDTGTTIWNNQAALFVGWLSALAAPPQEAQ